MEIEKLVEYRTVRHSARSEASVYLTTDLAHVNLQFSNPLICAMRTGRKIMCVGGSDPFEFLPGETLLINSSMALDIEFPEASPERPAECMVIEIDRVELDAIVTRVNDTLNAQGHGGRMELDWSRFAHLQKAPEVIDQMNRLVRMYDEEQGPFRDTLIEMGHHELVLRLLQAQASELLIERRGTVPDTGLDAVVEAIRAAPERRFTSEELAAIARMSEASLFRHFKARYGLTPARFASTYRVRRARELLVDHPIAEVAHALGFANAAHFTRVFSQAVGETPGEVQRRLRFGVAAE